jgi:hypothetical protein
MRHDGGTKCALARCLLLPALLTDGMWVDSASWEGGLPCLWRLCFGWREIVGALKVS